jgi:plastocyanin
VARSAALIGRCFALKMLGIREPRIWKFRAVLGEHGDVRRAVLLLAVIVGGVACGGGGPSAAPALNTVLVANFAFTPNTITVHAGDTVTWEFHQADAPHNVVSTSGPVSFRSGGLQGSGTYRHTFSQVGTYTYVCQVHLDMRGTVIVTQ